LVLHIWFDDERRPKAADGLGSGVNGSYLMSMRSSLAKASFAAATAAMILAGGLAAPQAALAQSSAYDSQSGTYYDPCRRDKTQREIAGGLLGAIGGAVLGSNLAHGGGRGGAAVAGGALGGLAGAGIGGATAACDSAAPAYYDSEAPPPPPPPPPCTMVESRVYFPDGTIQRDHVRACRDEDGRWFVNE
jgi:hypothetical protein